MSGVIRMREESARLKRERKRGIVFGCVDRCVSQQQQKKKKEEKEADEREKKKKGERMMRIEGCGCECMLELCIV